MPVIFKASASAPVSGPRPIMATKIIAQTKSGTARKISCSRRHKAHSSAAGERNGKWRHALLEDLLGSGPTQTARLAPIANGQASSTASVVPKMAADKVCNVRSHECHRNSGDRSGRRNAASHAEWAQHDWA